MNLTIEDIKGILSRVTYRLGWKFRVYQGDTRGAMLEIIATVDDSVNLGEFTKLEIYAGIPPYDSEKGFLGWLFYRLREAEIHECAEFFKVDRQPAFCPHKPMSDRDIL